jgi:hypothetical protein
MGRAIDRTGNQVSRLRIALAGTGVLVIGYALAGAFAQLGGKLGGVLIFLVAVLVLHDGIWLPVVLLAGVVLGRIVPARHRGVIRVAAIAATALTVFSVPLVLGRGRTADNPSALPLDYGRNLALILLGLAVVTALIVARARIRGLAGSARSSIALRRSRRGPDRGRKDLESPDDDSAG